MKLIRSLQELKAAGGHEPSGVAIGTFDGLHLGHQQVVRTLLEHCRNHRLKSVVYTFANHPREFTNKDALPNRIMSIDEKIDFFNELDLDELVMVEFDEDHMNLAPETFVREILVEDLGVRFLTAGYNFRFGAGAKGNGELLQSLGKELGFGVQIVPPYRLDGEVVSSSRIRALLAEGEIEAVNRLLGRHHTVSGNVVHGKRRGTGLGFPTANLEVSPNMTLICPGVYVTRTWIGKECHHSVSNVGYNPTFSQAEFNLETHIMDFSGYLYHHYIRVEFLHRLREERKYESRDALVRQIALDVAEAHAWFHRHKG